MEKQELIDIVIKALTRALSEEKPEMIYAVVGALQRVAHAGMADEDGHKLVTNLNWSDANDTENSNNTDIGSAKPNEDGAGPGADLEIGGQHQEARTDQPDNSQA